ncbi:hypothetical protein L596_020484 [Steinernema carpocapsae]|uniref:Uncharacterized protein n=1 Tax=Steinernema carpocapsae TaxID=34508 RepID=A0A4U5MTR9_STECR|nr:hypothetical protein L596_020484 [Steinernema carpocapsae]
MSSIRTGRTSAASRNDFKKIGTEESHTVESFERNVSGTPNGEPQRQFSSNTYTERKTYGRDQNGEIVVKIEREPRDPVRPVTPVLPVGPVGPNNNENLLRPVGVDISPLHIPRINVRKQKSLSSQSPRSFSSFQDQASPRSVSFQMSPRSDRSAPLSPRSNASSRASHTSVDSQGVPLKRVVKKSRLVSIHDGSPVSPYVETVTYVPVHQTHRAVPPALPMASPRGGSGCRSPRHQSASTDVFRNDNDNVLRYTEELRSNSHRSPRPTFEKRPNEEYYPERGSRRSARREDSYDTSEVYIVENPIYRD